MSSAWGSETPIRSRSDSLAFLEPRSGWRADARMARQMESELLLVSGLALRRVVERNTIKPS